MDYYLKNRFATGRHGTEENSGKEIITAYAVGFEVGAKLGIGVGQSIYDRGWHNTSAIGSIASAAAAAHLLKLDLEETKVALGIAASLAHGLRENFGTMTKPLHAGNAARNGSLAGLLAKRGFTASKHWLTADLGFGKAFGTVNNGLDDALYQSGHHHPSRGPYQGLLFHAGSPG